MERFIDMDEISDGKLYSANDLVRADCGGCAGCFSCCCGMGTSVVLDPLDISRLCTFFGCDIQALMHRGVDLNIKDSIILPNLRMLGKNGEEHCAFLNENGRCSVHPARSGFCRLFPLGRYYENGGFQYFLQIHECRMQNRAKVKVKKWIDTPLLAENERFVNAWHYFLKDVTADLRAGLPGMTPEAKALRMKDVNMRLLKLFYMTPYAAQMRFADAFAPDNNGGAEQTKQQEAFYKTFYAEFYGRLEQVRRALGIDMIR